MNGGDQLRASYDAHADVLYVSIGEPVPCEVVDDYCGVLFRVSVDNRMPSGVTILSFAEQWSCRLESLADKVSTFLGQPKDPVIYLLRANRPCCANALRAFEHIDVTASP